MLRLQLLVGICGFSLVAMTGCGTSAAGNSPGTRHAQAEQWMSQDNYELALDLYDRIIAVDPQDVLALIGRGDALTGLRRSDEAIRSYHQAIAIDGELTEAYCSRGWAYEWNEEWDKAIQDYRQALSLEAYHVDARCGLSWILATCPRDELRNGPEAVQLATEALQLSGEDAIILDTLGAGHAEMGNFELAIASAKQALRHLQENEHDYDDDFAPRVRARLKKYQQGLPHRDDGENGSQ